MNGGVRALAADGKISTIVPKRRGVGGMALHAENGLVIGGRNIIYEGFGGGGSATLLTPEVTRCCNRFQRPYDRRGGPGVG